MLHLDIEPGTDIALFNTLFTYVVDQGWHDKDFIAKHTRGFDDAMKANRMSLEDGSQDHRHPGGEAPPGGRVGLQAEGLGSPSAHLPRLREGHHLGQRQLPHPVVRWSSLVLATHNVGRRGTGVCRMGGHQEGYTRPPYPGDKKIYIDQEVIKGKRPDVHDLGHATHSRPRSTPSSTARGAARARADRQRGDGQGARGASVEQMVDVIYDACKNKGGLFVVGINLYPTTLAEDGAHAAAGRAPRRDEPHLDERRAALAPVGEVHGPARDRPSPTA